MSSTLQQRTPFSTGTIGLAVSNFPYLVHLVRVYANPRKIVTTGTSSAKVVVSALIQNIGPVPLNVRASFQAVDNAGRQYKGGSQVARLQPQTAAEFSTVLGLPPLGPYYVVAAAEYDYGAGWVADPDQGMTDVQVWPGAGVGQPYAIDSNGGAVGGAQIDYRDFPSSPWFPH